MGRAAQVLGLSKDELSAVVGKYRTTIDRSGLDPKTKEGELALLLLRVDRSLHALYGGDQALMRQRIEGLTRVANTLDALRG